MIPAFDEHGVLPALLPGEAGHSPGRSPYPADTLTFCMRFGNTRERRAILGGLLELRRALVGLGLTDGFQWLDGSFVESVETLRDRPPNDIDVVTFVNLGDKNAQSALAANAELFNPRSCKKTFRVDHYVISTSAKLDEKLARRVGYWYSMWSRQRDTERWKGFVSVPMVSNDADATAWVAAQDAVGGQR